MDGTGAMTTTGGMKARGHYIRKRLRFAGPARRLAGFAIIVLGVGILLFRLRAIDIVALKGVLVVCFAFALLSLAVAGIGLVRAWRRGYQGGGMALGAAALAIVTLAPFAFAGFLAYDNPQVSEAASDGMQAADIVAEPAGGSAEAGLVSGRRYQATAAQVFGVAKLVLADLGWHVSTVNANAPLDAEDGDLGVSGTIDIPVPTPRDSIDPDDDDEDEVLDQPDSSDYAIEAVATGPILALPSDVTIRIVEDGSETFVDLRSASRDVAWDLGQNRRFIEEFLTRLDTAMAGALTVVPAGDS